MQVCCGDRAEDLKAEGLVGGRSISSVKAWIDAKPRHAGKTSKLVGEKGEIIGFRREDRTWRGTMLLRRLSHIHGTNPMAVDEADQSKRV